MSDRLPFDEEVWFDDMVEEQRAVQALYDEDGELRPLTPQEEKRAEAIERRNEQAAEWCRQQRNSPVQRAGSDGNMEPDDVG
jgi:hypothetical protein